jgi:hypothetical protein
MINATGSANQLFRLVNPREEAISNVDKVTEGVSHIIADEIVHSSEAADLIRYARKELLSRAQCYKKFPARAFVHDKLFQSSLLFVGKARSLPYSGALQMFFNRVGSCFANRH